MVLFKRLALYYRQVVFILLLASNLSSSSSSGFAFITPLRMNRKSSHQRAVHQHLQRHDDGIPAFLVSRHVMSMSANNEMEHNDDDDPPSEENNNTSSSSSRVVPPPFPRSSYHLSRNEKQNRHFFISFIDHFDESYTQVARLIEPRRYARSQQFDNDNNNNQFPSSQQQPTIDDVACPPSLYSPLASLLAWNRLPARIIVGTMAYFTFPIIVNILESYTTIDYQVLQQQQDAGATDLTFLERLNILAAIGNDDASSSVVVSINKENSDRLTNLVNLYLPGVAIVLGTYFSMTLDILYTRVSQLQKTVSLEASTMAYCFQLLLDLFANDRKRLIASTQCMADQINVLVRDSRGKEIMRIIYNDPYANILHIVQSYNRENAVAAAAQQQPSTSSSQPSTVALSLVGDVRDVIRQLFELRTKRLNCEANALAPAHYDLMTFLAGLLLVGTTLGTVATAQTNGIPTEVSRILFSALVVCYTTIYEMAYDLNRPFDGIYQIKRSGAAMYFLQIKHLVVNHAVLRDHITFHPIMDESADDTEIPKVDELEQREIWYN